MASKQNIIYVYFKGKHLTISKSQYQYNHGQFLYFADLDLPQTFEVHFSNRDKGESKPQIGSNKLVEIPDEYFWSGALQIYAWIYLHSGADDGETVYEVKIPLMKRAKPTDEEPLPQQQGVIDRAIAELNNAIEITTENANKTNADKTIVNNIKDEVVVLKDEIDSTATTINQKAQEAIAASERAETSAQNAATSENKALNYSQQAEQSAQSALESKNIAQQKSEIATNASAEALGYRNEAQEAKNQAVQAKQNIVDYRDETKRYRDETLNLKNNVQTLKNQIDETAEEIDETASAVRDNAESANRSASSANESASQASQSANTANEFKNQANTYKNEAKEYRNQAEDFKNQSEANVTHYPKIINDYWYVWDATNEEYINTNVDANGIKGDTGNGIESITLNDDYTLTIAFTDGTSYTTSSIRGEKGDTGESGVYIGTEEPTDESIDVWIDTDENADDVVTDVQVNGTSVVNDSVAEIPIANSLRLGVVKANYLNGISVKNDGNLIIYPAGSSSIKNGTNENYPLNAKRQHESVFYGLAKASGTDEKDSELPVGQYTEEAKASIKNMLGVDVKKDDVYDTYVTDTATGRISIFEDGADDIPLKNLTVTLEPVQDLHGYDSPWVAGVGVNKFKFVGNGYVDTRGNIASPTNLVNGYSEYVPVKSGDNIWITGTFTSCVFAFYDSDKGFLSRYTSSSGTASEDGYIRISVNLDNSTSVTAESCVTNQIQLAISDTMPTEYYPYENICPISGWTGMEIQQMGKNLFDPNEYLLADCTKVDYEESPDTYVGNKYKFYHLHGDVSADPSATGLIPMKPYGQLTISYYKYLANNDRIYFHYTDADEWVSHSGNVATVGYKSYTSVANRICDGVALDTNQGSTADFRIGALQVEVSPSRTEYRPYAKNIIPISWESEVGVVYKGKLDVLSGLLTMTHELIDLGSLTWTYRSDRECFESGAVSKAAHNNGDLTIMCDCFTPITNRPTETTLDNVIYFNSTAGSRSAPFRVRCTALNGDVNAFTELITGHHAVYLMYSVDKIKVQLTPHEVRSLIGQNNIFANTGNTSIEYRADTKLYINKKITEAISALT